jgi:ferredoxin
MTALYLKNVVTLSVDPKACRGCGVCVDVCPQRVLYLDDKRIAIGDRDACMECGACARNCAHGAITVRAGVGCAAALLASGGDPANCNCA